MSTPLELIDTWRDSAKKHSAEIETSESPFEIWTAQATAKVLRECATALAQALNGDTAEGERVIGRVEVARVVDMDGGMRDDIHTDDGSGEELDLPTAVGMLAIAQHTLLCGCGGDA